LLHLVGDLFEQYKVFVEFLWPTEA